MLEPLSNRESILMSINLEPLFDQLVSKEIPLANLYLDPNNPRFVGLESIFVKDDRIRDEGVQAAAQAILDQKYGLDRLRLSISVNGYLPIDRIVVRPIGDDAYVVLEGNRRIAAAKSLPSTTVDGQELDSKVIESVGNIPALVYTGEDTNAAWLFQGIRHILGINDWSAYNKARLLVEQMEEEGLSLASAGQRFGTSPQGAGQWVRSYKAFDQARSLTDYGKEVDERFYPYLQELFGRSSLAMKDWLGWDDKAYNFTAADRFDEFVGWFYPKGDLPEDADPADFRGDWDKKRISNRDDIRKIAYLIVRAPKHFQLFRDGMDFEEAYGQAMVEQYDRAREREDIDKHKQLIDLVEKCSSELKDIPLSIVRNANAFDELKSRLDELTKSIKFVTTEG